MDKKEHLNNSLYKMTHIILEKLNSLVVHSLKKDEKVVRREGTDWHTMLKY